MKTPNSDALLAYRSVPGFSSTIKSVTIDDLRPLFPHLTDNHLHGAMEQARASAGNTLFFLAAPATVIKGAVLVRWLTRETADSPELMLTSPFLSMADEGSSEFRGEALAYAQEHWGSDLVAKTWKDVLVFDLLPSGNEPLLLRVVCAISRTNQELVDDRSAPKHELIEQCTVLATADPAELLEIGQFAGWTHLTCSRCGHGIEDSGCFQCNSIYMNMRTALGCNSNIGMPLPVAEAALAAGYKFTVEPEASRKVARKRFDCPFRPETMRRSYFGRDDFGRIWPTLERKDYLPMLLTLPKQNVAQASQ